MAAVGDHPQADALLEPDGVFHGPVFDGSGVAATLELARRLRGVVTGLEQLARP